mgnify:CR=1 FL=1
MQVGDLIMDDKYQDIGLIIAERGDWLTVYYITGSAGGDTCVESYRGLQRFFTVLSEGKEGE